ERSRNYRGEERDGGGAGWMTIVHLSLLMTRGGGGGGGGGGGYTSTTRTSGAGSGRSIGDVVAYTQTPAATIAAAARLIAARMDPGLSVTCDARQVRSSGTPSSNRAITWTADARTRCVAASRSNSHRSESISARLVSRVYAGRRHV